MERKPIESVLDKVGERRSLTVYVTKRKIEFFEYRILHDNFLANVRENNGT